jgi:hypothetical protein
MKSKKRGCLIIFAVIVAVLGFLFYPLINSALLRANSIKSGHVIRCIYMALLEESMEYEAITANSAAGVIWPTAGQYKSSTEYFKTLMATNYLKGADFAFFGGPGIPIPEDMANPSKFTAENNGWGIALLPADCDSYEKYKDAPFLFSRNVGFGSPPGPPKAGDTIADMTGLQKGVKPFGNKQCLVITYGGTVKFLHRSVATQKNFNPKGEHLQVIMP